MKSFILLVFILANINSIQAQELKKCGAKASDVSTTDDNLDETQVKAQEIKMCVMQASKPPVIDGVADDSAPWGATWNNLSLNNPNSTTNGMTAKFQILFDQKNIYIVVSVTDATPNNDSSTIPNTYERDCIDVFFAMDTAYNIGEIKNGFWQVRIQREAVDEKSYVDGNSGIHRWSVSSLINSPNFKYGVISDASRWVMEMQLPIDTLASGAKFDGDNFLFEIISNDNTTGMAGGRTQRRNWYSNVENNSSVIGELGLVSMNCPCTPNYIPKPTSERKYIYDGTTLSTSGTFIIYDVCGRAVLKGFNSASLALLKNGIYLVKGKNVTTKIIKK